ncbi:MAG: hypothetical protein J1E35_07425 [Lachnospiraceae bacterium]|nr:hypothetical protein [Lachnospiraceae bacterium]
MAVLRVILFILKLLGILVLLLLGLVLLVVLLGLLAPIRYKGKLKKQEEPENAFFADALVSWLNPLIRVRIRYREGKRGYTVRLLGICLFDSEKRKKKEPKEKKRKKKRRKGLKHKQEEPVTETTLSAKEDSGQGTESKNSAETAKENPKEETKEDIETSAAETAEDAQEEDGVPKKKEGLFGKLKGFLERLKELPERIKGIIRRICGQVSLLWRKKEAAVAFLEEELHIAALVKAMKALKMLLGHILPGTLKGRVEFGTGNPETTGKALAALGILYAAYGKGITIVPDFYEKRVAVDLTFRGRIRLGTLLVILLRLIRDKQARGFYKDWKQLVSLLKEKAE